MVHRFFGLILFLTINPAGFLAELSNPRVSDDFPPIPITLADYNPLHLLCWPCKGLSGLLGGILNSILGANLLKQLGIFACSYVVSIILPIPFVPNLICVAVFEILGILAKKTGNGICTLLFLCPKKSAKSILMNKPENFGEFTPHERKIIQILDSEIVFPLSKNMEKLYVYLINSRPVQMVENYKVLPDAQNAIRSFLSAVDCQMNFMNGKKV